LRGTARPAGARGRETLPSVRRGVARRKFMNYSARAKPARMAHPVRATIQNPVRERFRSRPIRMSFALPSEAGLA